MTEVAAGTNRLYAARNRVNNLDRLAVLVPWQPDVDHRLHENSAGRLVSLEDAKHPAAGRTLLLASRKVLGDAVSAECVAAIQLPRRRDGVHADDAVIGLCVGRGC